ncbi:MAG: lipopolysaccharide biosynthesis protein [Candidatus Methylumidiphilus sp.]
MTSQPPEAPPPLSAAEHNRLDSSFIKGVAWTGASKWSIQIITWVATLIVARLLTPEDYGIVAMAGVLTGMLALLTEFGIGSSIVMLSGLSEIQIAQINALSILFGIAGFVVSCVAAVPVGIFFDTPVLPPVVAAIGLGFIIKSFQTVPSALLQKERRFKALSVIEAIRSTAQSFALVLFAWMGFRYWSLVIGALLSYALALGLTLLVRRHRLEIPRFSLLKYVLGFSGQVLVCRISWYVYFSADSIIAGRLLGQTALGNYSLANTLANMPVEKITALVGNVTPAFYAAVKEDPRAIRRYLLRPIEAISLVTFPVMLGMSLVAKDAVLTLLGEKWEASITALQILALYACVRSIMPLFPQVLMAVGEIGFVMWNGIISMIVLPVAFYFGSQWGIAGIAAAWVIAYPVNAIPLYWRAHQKIGMTHGEFFRTLWPAINGTVFMVLAVVAVKLILDGYFLPTAQLVVQACPHGSPYLPQISQMLQWLLDGHFGHGVRLIVQVVCGAVAYIAALWIFHSERLLAFRRSLAAVRK